MSRTPEGAARAQTGQDAKRALLAGLGGGERPTAHHDRCSNEQAMQDLAQARADRVKAEAYGNRELLERAKKAEAKAEAACAEATSRLHLRALPRHEWRALKALPKHQEGKDNEDDDWNVVTFPAALIAACSYHPETNTQPFLSEDEVDEFLDGWGEGEWRALFGKAVGINQQSRDPSLPFGSAVGTRSSPKP